MRGSRKRCRKADGVVQQADEVVLRRWRKGGGVIALFPDLPATTDELVTSYQHVGQHGAADFQHVISQTVPVPPDQPDQGRDELLGELRSIGYHPAARLRRPRRRRKH